MAQIRRWLTSVTKEAAKAEIQMPWSRGARREASRARRTAAEKPVTRRATS